MLIPDFYSPSSSQPARFLFAGGHYDVTERARLHPGGGEPGVRSLQPEEVDRAQHPAPGRPALTFRPAVADTG